MRNTLILILFAVILGGYVWFYEIEGEEERKAEKELEEKIVTVEKDSIKTIIINDFDKTFYFEKNNDGWEIVEPVRTGADQSAVSTLLSSLTNAKKSRSFSVKPADKAQFGLRNAPVSIKVIAFNGSADSVQLGIKTSIGEDMYMTKSSTDTVISITPITLKNNAQKTLFSWRDKKAVHFNKDQVRSLNLKSGRNSFSFSKEGTDWKMTKPLQVKADNSKVDAVLNKLDYTNIKSVEAEEAVSLAKYGLNNPEYTIELLSGPEMAKSSISFSRLDGDKAYGKDDVRPQIFTVDSSFIKPFKSDLFDFRDKDLVDFNKSSIDRINLLNENELMVFSKDSSDRWQIESGEPIKNYKINDLLDGINNLKVDAFISENPSYLMPYGLANPGSKIELFAGDTKDVDLEFGTVKNDRMYVRNPGTGSVVAIKTDKLKNILLKKDDVYDPTAKKADTDTKN